MSEKRDNANSINHDEEIKKNFWVPTSIWLRVLITSKKCGRMHFYLMFSHYQIGYPDFQQPRMNLILHPHLMLKSRPLLKE